MNLEDAVQEVLAAHDEKIEATGVGSRAGNMLRDYFRANEGMVFACHAPDAPAFGDKVVFIPIAQNPPENRPKFGSPIAGTIKAVMGVHDTSHFPPGFPFMVEIDDAKLSSKRTIVYAELDELQITSKHLAA